MLQQVDIRQIRRLIKRSLARGTSKVKRINCKTLGRALFSMDKKHLNEVLPKSETGKGFTYCLNQEKYLKVFLEDGNVPAAEASIRGFCIENITGTLLTQLMELRLALLFVVLQKRKSQQLKTL